MPDGVTTQLDKLEKPLTFASGNNFLNLSRIRNMEAIVSDIVLNLTSGEKDPAIRNHLQNIRENFKGFDLLEQEAKKQVISNALKTLSRMRSFNKEKDNVPGLVTPQYCEERSGLSGVECGIRYLRGVGARIASVLAKRGITTVEDLLFYFPRKYEDRRNVQPILSVKHNHKCIVIGVVLSARQIRARKGGFFYKVTIADDTGKLDLIWFRANRRYIQNTYRKGVKVVVSGEVTIDRYGHSPKIIHPKPQDMEIIEEGWEVEDQTHFNRIVPIYPLMEGLAQRRIRSIIKMVIQEYASRLTYSVPEKLVSKFSLLNLPEAIIEAHFPDKFEKVVDLDDPGQVAGSLPHKTIIFFEFLMLQLGLGLKKRSIVKKKGVSFKNNGEIASQFINSLPFGLTVAQLKVIEEIKNDMNLETPMNRLVQGDVGSGKTIVSIVSMLIAVESGYQSVLMAPTEILCEQHYRSIVNYLSDFDINIVLLKSALSVAEKRRVIQSIKSGESQIVVGTHALIEDGVEFSKLGLVVIDEQHRFGVMQRAKLMDKADNPDVLVLTATPIPRTLAITVYGDLDTSFIDELPAGRKKVTTLHYRDSESSRSELYGLLESELRDGRQGYVICPFINESDNPELKHVKYMGSVYDDLKSNISPKFDIGLLHGQMDSDEKEEVMKKFLDNEFNILVSTTVIEVGVNVPNATFMVIENAERYGLSQLHQLRGRIGRAELKSFCVLISSSFVSEDAEKKLNIMTETYDGFKIAETDLQMRGPGDFLGTKQSGIPQFRLANLVRDWQLLNKARDAAFELLAEDPNLDKYDELKRYVKSRWENVLGFRLIS